MRKRDYLTTDEVQNILGISKPTLLKRLAAGEIAAERADETARAIWEISPQSIFEAIKKERNVLNEQEAKLIETFEKVSGKQWKH